MKAQQKTRFSEMRKVVRSDRLPQACSGDAGDGGVTQELPEHTLTCLVEMGIMHPGNPGDITVNSFTLKVEQICPKKQINVLTRIVNRSTAELEVVQRSSHQTRSCYRKGN